jgi:peptidyl-prolyl cis-trans isomerase D
MALIGKIREKSGIAVTLIAIGLLIFIVGGDILSTNSFILGTNQETIGVINGVKISFKEYNAKVEQLKTNFTLNNGKTPTDQELNSIKEQAWNDLIFEYSYKKNCEKAGILVSEEEITDIVQGTNIHPSIRQVFVNPETKEFEKERLLSYLQNFSRLKPEQQYLWLEFEKQLVSERLKNKFENLLKATVYTTKEEAKRNYISQNTKLNGKCLYIPYYTVPDTLIKFKESELVDYLNQNKEKYRTEEYVAVEYVSFPITPSKEDSLKQVEELKSIALQFEKTSDDTIFVNSNSDSDNNIILANIGNLPKILTDNVKEFEVGKVYGPFLDYKSYKIFKVGEVRKDSVYSIRASHILFKTNTNDAAQKQETLKKCKEVLNRIKKGESFEELAAQYGSDGTASKGGDLGWFSEGQMVKKFNDACFNKGTVGLLPEPVETEFGYHIIKITAPKTNAKYVVYVVEKIITPSEVTRDEVYNKASQFHSLATSKMGFDDAVKTFENGKYNKYTSEFLTKNSLYLNNLTGVGEIIRWAFKDASVGDISPVFNPEGHYIVCKLTKKRQKGTGKLEDYRNEILTKVRNEKKAKIIIAKLDTIRVKTIDELAQKYGNDAQIADATNAVPSYNSLCNFGYDPYAAGVAFATPKGSRSKIIIGETGIGIIEVNDVFYPEDIAEYTGTKKLLETNLKNSINFLLNEFIKDYSNIVDDRYLFY